MKVYGDIKSGNCYKVKLLLSLLGIRHEWIELDILAGETQTEAFLAMNPNAKIPLLVLDNGKSLAESNAILGYLAEQTDLIPKDPFAKAKVYEWLFFEQYSHEPFIAVARFINKYLGLPAERLEEYQQKQPGGHKALAIMEKHLKDNQYLVGDSYTIADISLYAYTHVADEGGFDLSAYPALLAWLNKISSHPKHIGMQLKAKDRG